MNIRSQDTSIPSSRSAALSRSLAAAGCMATLLAVMLPTKVAAGPPSAEDDIDYAASGFRLPPGVNPTAWSTAAGVSAAGGMNYASQPAISGPMMGGPGRGGPMIGNTPMSQKIPSSFPSGPIPGMAPPGMPVSTGLPGPIGPAAYQAAMQNPGAQVMPINYQQAPVGYPYETYGDAYTGGYGHGTCDGGCDGACSSGACGSGGGFRGILPALVSQCSSCNGGGCGVCNSRAYQSGCLGRGGVLGDWCSGRCMDGDFGLLMRTMGGNMSACYEALKPYSEAGKCAQRWYDLSAEASLLGHNFSQGNMVLSTRTAGGDPVLSLSDAKASDLEGGVRVSAAVIMGVGGNLEMVYNGGHEWSNSASAFSVDPNNPDLFSYISDFGMDPAGGYDDPDRSIFQEVYTDSAFHSGEVNYRRRTVGPGCRFQGSWLVGARYLRMDNGFGFNAMGTLNDGTGGTTPAPASERRFYNSITNTKNNIFVGQIGYDVWWNMVPGVQLGFGMKGGWGQNDWKRSTLLHANSAGPGATAGVGSISDRDRLSTVMGEIETKIIYRLSHSWSVRMSHQLIAIDDIVNTVPDRDFVRAALTGPVTGGTPITTPPRTQFSSIVLQGFTIGAEYIW